MYPGSLARSLRLKQTHSASRLVSVIRVKITLELLLTAVAVLEETDINYLSG